MSQATQELEKNPVQGQMDAINAGMVRWFIGAYGENILGQFHRGFLPENAKEAAGQIMLIAAEVKQHFQKQGSLEGLRIIIGFSLTDAHQGFYIRNSLIGGLIDRKEMERLDDRSCSKWPSSIEGLEIRREHIGDIFEYLLAEKEPNWTEA